MVKPTIVIRDGKRYVKVKNPKGKPTLVKIAKSISERELIQWMIKHFKPKKRKAKKAAEPKIKIATAPMTAVVTNDQARVDARLVKEKLDEATKDLDQRKLAEAIVKAGAGISQPALPPGSRETMQRIEAATQETTPETPTETIPEPPIFTMSPAKRPAVKPTKPASTKPAASPEKPIYSQSQADAKLAEKDKEASDAVKIAEIRVRLDGLTNARKAQLTNENIALRIKTAKTFSQPQLRDMTEGTKQGSNASNEKMIQWLMENKPDEVKAAVNEQTTIVKTYYDPLIAEKNAEIDAIKKQSGKGSLEAIQEEGTSEDQLNQAMKKYPEFLGVIAVNEIPLLMNKLGNKKRVCWIMNTDPRSKPGSHWVCFLIDARDNGSYSVEYYNPLADPIQDLPKHVMSDLKKIVKDIHGQKTYLKFKTNKITDQNDTSNNCGEFCVHFLQARLDGQSFSKASGWDAAGEKNIELWKVGKPWLAPTKFDWISGQSDELNLRDFDKPVRRTATRILQRMKDTLFSRQTASDSEPSQALVLPQKK